MVRRSFTLALLLSLLIAANPATGQVRSRNTGRGRDDSPQRIGECSCVAINRNPVSIGVSNRAGLGGHVGHGAARIGEPRPIGRDDGVTVQVQQPTGIKRSHRELLMGRGICR